MENKLEMLLSEGFEALKNKLVNLDVNEESLKSIKVTEYSIASAITDTMFEYIRNINIINECFSEFTNIEDTITINECHQSLSALHTLLIHFNKVTEKKLDSLLDKENINGNLKLKGAREQFVQLNQFLEKSVKLFEAGSKIETVTRQQTSKNEYLRIITKLNAKFTNAYQELYSYVQGMDEDKSYWLYAKDILKDGLDATEYFNKIDIKYLKEEPQKKVVSMPQQFVKSKAEQEREFYINKANDLYNQLYLDWIRDLESQYSFSTRDKYYACIEKFNKFNERFQMPLKSTVSTGMAKEVCNQINNLMNSITDISSESYSVGLYR